MDLIHIVKLFLCSFINKYEVSVRKTKINIYLQNMSIKRRLVRFDQEKRVFSLSFFMYSLSPIIINYACPNCRTKCAMSLVNSQRFLLFHPTVMLIAYVNCCFIIIRQNVFPVSFSSRIS